MRSFFLLSTVFYILSSSLAAPVLPRIAWQVETSAKPADRRIDLIYGETVDLEVKFLAYTAAMDLTGATVTLHGRTNGMAVGYSFQLAGAASSNGLATVRLPVDAWLPQGLTSAAYTLEVAQTNGASILRAGGTAYLSGTGAGTASAPLPTPLYADLTNRLTAIEATAGTVSGITGPYVVSVNGQTGAVTVATADQGAKADTALQPGATNGLATEASLSGLSNTLSIAIAAPSDALRLITPDASRWIDATGGVWQVSSVTNYFVYNQGMDFYHIVQPTWSVTNFPFDDGDGFVGTLTGDFWAKITYSGSTGWELNTWPVALTYPATLSPKVNYYGTAVISQQVSIVTSRVDTVALSSELIAATGGLATASSVIAATGGLATVASVIAATGGLASAESVSASIIAATGGLATAASVIAATGGLATDASVIAATGGLVNASGVTNIAAALIPWTIGLMGPKNDGAFNTFSGNRVTIMANTDSNTTCSATIPCYGVDSIVRVYLWATHADTYNAPTVASVGVFWTVLGTATNNPPAYTVALTNLAEQCVQFYVPAVDSGCNIARYLLRLTRPTAVANGEWRVHTIYGRPATPAETSAYALGWRP